MVSKESKTIKSLTVIGLKSGHRETVTQSVNEVTEAIATVTKNIVYFTTPNYFKKNPKEPMTKDFYVLVDAIEFYHAKQSK